MWRLIAVCGVALALVRPAVVGAETLTLASGPGVDEVQVAPALAGFDAASALASISPSAWQPAVACSNLWTWPWQTDTTPPTPPYAAWISDANPPDNLWTESWRWFRRTITLPAGASVTSGSVTWTADNAGLVYLNQTVLGSSGEVFGPGGSDLAWMTIKTYPVDSSRLHEGDNELLFLVHNYGPAGVNPTGLIYKMSLTGQNIWNNFPDAPPDYWAYAAIMSCFHAGIVNGYPDGLYHPADVLKRSQMAVFMARAVAGGDAHVPSGPAEATFPDVPADGYGEDGTQPYWAYRYIEYCASHGIVQGYWDGYHPEEAVSRGQMAVYVARAEAGGDSSVPPYTGEPTFPDVPADYWALRYVEYCAAHGIVQGYWNGYHPEEVVTRDQMAVYVARAFGLM